MKITYKGDYALKGILDLAYQYKHNTVVPLSDISRRQDAPEKYLEQIMLILKKTGIVGSKRGKGGGFFLLKGPKDITLGEVVRIIEGPIEPIACADCNKEVDCIDEKHCAFREVWTKVSAEISEIVDNITFQDIMQRTDELRRNETENMYYI